MDSLSGAEYIQRNCSSRDRVLLINPPVIESRYQWVRWNQPLDLLKLSTFLKSNAGCDVKLYDFMLPINNKVVRTANKPDHEILVAGHSFNLWRYGSSELEFSKWLDSLTSNWRPTLIWVTSLTSYWWKGVRNTIARLKSRFSDVPVVISGRYPELEATHAIEHSFADVLIESLPDLCDYVADFDLYEVNKPAFCALDIRSQNWIKETISQFSAGNSNFVFFNDPLIDDPAQFIDRMARFTKLNLKTKTHARPKFYGLCGLYPTAFTASTAQSMREAGFIELHFEYEAEGARLNVDSYRQVYDAFLQTGWELQPDQKSGFIYIGLPDDDLGQIINHTLNLFEIFGSVILKPWSATPGSEFYKKFEDQIETKLIEFLSPHLFPFAVVNGLSPKDYEELYVLVAALNQKVRSVAFDSFPGTLAYEMIRNSLSREVWKLTK